MANFLLSYFSFLPISVRSHIDFLTEVDDLSMRPRCTGKIKSNMHTFGSLQVHITDHPPLPSPPLGYPMYPDFTPTLVFVVALGGVETVVSLSVVIPGGNCLLLEIAKLEVVDVCGLHDCKTNFSGRIRHQLLLPSSA